MSVASATIGIPLLEFKVINYNLHFKILHTIIIVFRLEELLFTMMDPSQGREK